MEVRGRAGHTFRVTRQSESVDFTLIYPVTNAPFYAYLSTNQALELAGNLIAAAAPNLSDVRATERRLAKIERRLKALEPDPSRISDRP